MSSPFLSICVPTRNRSAYLEHCLRTILAQQFSDYEVVVAENSDPPGREETRRIMKGLNGDRIVYFEQPRVVSMTENYEAALGRARGTYCMCIGDDDGVVAGSLEIVARDLRTRNPAVLKSPTASYFWPGSPWHPESMLYLAVEGPSAWIDSKSALAKVAAFEAPYYILPMIYYAFVRRDVIERIVERQGSFFADTASIDIYSGMAIASIVESYMVCERPFAIAGQSPKSNGAAFLGTTESPIVEDYKAHHDLEAQCARAKLPFSRSLDVFTLLELSRALQFFPEASEFLDIDKAECFRRCSGMVGKCSILPEARAKRESLLEEFRAADPDFDWQSLLNESACDPGQRFYFPRGELYLYMASKAFGPDIVRCNDVYEASEMIARIYNGKSIPLVRNKKRKRRGRGAFRRLTNLFGRLANRILPTT